jgi:4,5-dihydroxyphthalate decarboxylase
MGGKQELTFPNLQFEFITPRPRDNTFVALPVFPSRVFRHGYIYVNRKAGIRDLRTSPATHRHAGTHDRRGLDRGHLMHQYGVDLLAAVGSKGAINHAGSHGDPERRRS